MKDTAPVQLVFMLEEESAMHFLERLLPAVLPSRVSYLCIPHQGKEHLRKSIPIKLKQWLAPNAFFVILHDQDNHPDCKQLKRELQALCAGSRHAPLIRIICRELEAWYFGDLDAVQKAFPEFKAAGYKRRARFRNPDSIVKPSDHLQRMVKGFTKRKAAISIPRHMAIDKNTSSSFKHVISGLRKVIATRTNIPGN